MGGLLFWIIIIKINQKKIIIKIIYQGEIFDIYKI